MSRVVALIQARMGSTRFPGKMLANLGGYPILEWVVQRVSHAQLIDKVVLATTDLPRDDPLVALADQLGVEVFRGSEADVLGRFATAAAQHEADLVVRICADNPFIDADEIDRLVTHFKKTSCDYACNHQERLGNCYADGFGAEILANSLLQKISLLATEQNHREHATSYIWDHASEFHIEAVPAPRELAYPELRFDVDTAQDFERLQEIVAAGVRIDTAAPVITNIALGNDRALLVTTDVKKSPVNVGNTYFLGAWCFSSRQEEQSAREAGRIIPYHWDNRDKLKVDFKRLQHLNDVLINELMLALNDLHGINQNKTFWKLLLGYWLNVYTTVIFDRWESLTQATRQKKTLVVEVLPADNEMFASNDTGTFVRAATESSQWNEALFALLIEFMPEIKSISIVDENHRGSERVRQGSKLGLLKTGLKKFVNAIVWKLKSKERFFLISTYLPIKELLMLEMALGQVPLPRFSFGNQLVAKFDPLFRQWRLPVKPEQDGFEKIVRDLLPKFLPRVFVEGFQDLMSSANTISCHQPPNVIFTSNCHFSDDFFKSWAATNITKGARMVVGEHGGLGVGLFNGAHSYELSVANTYLSTGWQDSQNRHVLPVGNFRVMGRSINPSPTGMALMVCGSMPRYAFDIRSMALSGQQLDYLEDQFSFVDALPIRLQSEIQVRLYPSDYGWEQKLRWLDRHPSIRFDDMLSLEKSLRKCRLFIGTYAATTYVDTLALNFPTVIFWNPRLWEIRTEARPVFDALKKAGIFHETPQSAAAHISRIWNNLQSWWCSEEVQIARGSFCKGYSTMPTNLRSLVKSALINEAERSTVRNPR